MTPLPAIALMWAVAATNSAAPPAPIEVRARLAAVTLVDTGKGGTGPYREALVAHLWDVQGAIQGTPTNGRVKVVSWFKHDNKLLPSSGWRVGQTATLRLVPFDSRRDLAPVFLADDHVNVVDLWYDTSVDLSPVSGPKPAMPGGTMTLEAALAAQPSMKDLIPRYAASRGRMWLMATGDSRVAQSFGSVDALVRDYTVDKTACQNLGVPSSPMPVQELAIRCAVGQNPALEWVVWGFGARFVSQKGHETALLGPPWPPIAPAAEAPTPPRSKPEELGPVGSGNWSLNQPAWDFFEDTVRELNRRNVGVLCVMATWKIYVEGAKLDHGTPYAALPVYQERMRSMEKRYPYFVYVCTDLILSQGEYFKDHATRVIAPWLSGPTWADFLRLSENRPRARQTWWPCRPGMQLADDPSKGRFATIPATWRDLPARRMPAAGKATVDVTVDRDVDVHVAGASPAGFTRSALSLNGQPVSTRRFSAGRVAVELPEGALTVVIEPLDRAKPGPGRTPIPTH